jgi:hypothetical protein
MTKANWLQDRRSFLGGAAALGAGALSPGTAAAMPPDDRVNVLGPKSGYTPQIGTLVSMLTWMQRAITGPVKGLTQAELDYLFDVKANTIGALLMHLAATETYYGLHTFEGMPWGSWPAEMKKKWDAAMELDDAGRTQIKGHDLDYYMKALQDARANTLKKLAGRDDVWLLAVDEKWPWGPTNNYCKWFHVCEHISHHVGQISFLRSRLKQG